VKSSPKLHLVPADGQMRKLNPLKIAELASLKPFIPPIYHEFYDSLLANSEKGSKVLEVADDMLVNSEDEYDNTYSQMTDNSSSTTSSGSNSLSNIMIRHLPTQPKVRLSTKLGTRKAVKATQMAI